MENITKAPSVAMPAPTTSDEIINGFSDLTGRIDDARIRLDTLVERIRGPLPYDSPRNDCEPAGGNFIQKLDLLFSSNGSTMDRIEHVMTELETIF